MQEKDVLIISLPENIKSTSDKNVSPFSLREAIYLGPIDISPSL